MEEISKACSHVWCVVLCLLLGYRTSHLTVCGGRGNGNMENKTFPKSSLYNNLYLRTAYVVVRNNLCISCVFIEELHIKAHGE